MELLYWSLLLYSTALSIKLDAEKVVLRTLLRLLDMESISWHRWHDNAAVKVRVSCDTYMKVIIILTYQHIRLHRLRKIFSSFMMMSNTTMFHQDKEWQTSRLVLFSFFYLNAIFKVTILPLELGLWNPWWYCLLCIIALCSLRKNE